MHSDQAFLANQTSYYAPNKSEHFKYIHILMLENKNAEYSDQITEVFLSLDSERERKVHQKNILKIKITHTFFPVLEIKYNTMDKLEAHAINMYGCNFIAVYSKRKEVVILQL